MTGLDVRRVQQALVCMHFDPAYAAAVYGPNALPELGPRERELLRSVDPRALATDAMRRTRALHVILDEYPVSAAVVGLDLVDRFFASPAFRACVFARGSMALAFGRDHLGNRAKGVGSIETAMARARRDDRARAREGELVRAPGIELALVPVGSLAYYQRGRQRLGPEPIVALAKLRKPWSDPPPRRGQEHLLVEAKPDGTLALGTASAPLVELLRAAEQPRPRASLRAAAIELGAEPDEADELLDDLLRDGLLRGPT
jgi:hypothetical protein